jgi:hypothetical protein
MAEAAAGSEFRRFWPPDTQRKQMSQTRPATKPSAVDVLAPAPADTTPADRNDIEKVLRDLFPPLARHEVVPLRRMIESGEITPRVVVWAEPCVVVDGRETRRICEELGREHQTEERDFADIEDVVRWRIETQLGRRNLTPLAASYYRGKLYLSMKRQGRRSDLAECQSGEKRTDGLVGRMCGVGARTVSRDAELCKALDAIADKQAGEVLDPVFGDGFVLGTDFRSSVLSGRIRPTRGEVFRLSRMRLDEMARAVRDMVASRKKPRRTVVPPAPKPDEGSPRPAKEGPTGAERDEGASPTSTPPEVADPPAATAGPVPAALRPEAASHAGTERHQVAADPGHGPGEERIDAPEAGTAEDAIDGTGLAEINRVWGRLGRATRLAFLTQDEVSKVVSEAGYVRLLRSCG